MSTSTTSISKLKSMSFTNLHKGFKKNIRALLIFLFLCFFLSGFQVYSPLLANQFLKVIIEPSEKVTLSPSLAGHVIELAVKEGDNVTEGMVLLKMDSREEELEIERLKRVIEKKKYDHTSLSRLLKDDMTSKEEMLQAKLQLQLAAIELEKAELSLKRRSIRSSMDGVVVKVAVQKGQWIGQGQGVIQVINYTRLYGTALMNKMSVEKIKSGDQLKVIFDKASNEKGIVSASVIFIDPSFDPVTGLKMVKFEISNRDLKIEPGIEAFLKMENSGKKNAE